MQQNMIFTESELNNNSLLRKMRNRFVYNDHMTIGEIMLRRAEIDANAAAKTVTQVASVAMAETQKKVKRVKAPAKKRADVPTKNATQNSDATDAPSATAHRHGSTRRYVITTCIGVILFAALVLSFALPMFGSAGISAQTVSGGNSDYSAQSVSTANPDTASLPAESNSSFDNVMSAFSYSFGESAE